MKKSIIIVSSVVFIFILAMRAFFIHFDDLKRERRAYVEQLQYEFSGQIDSIQLHNKPHGLIFFHVTKGKADHAHEGKLNIKLNRHAELLLLDFKSNGIIEIASETADKYLKEDSISINTIENRIGVFRKGSKISESDVLPWLRGSEF